MAEGKMVQNIVSQHRKRFFFFKGQRLQQVRLVDLEKQMRRSLRSCDWSRYGGLGGGESGIKYFWESGKEEVIARSL